MPLKTREQVRERDARLRSEGRCVRCGQTIDGSCAKCVVRKRNSRRYDPIRGQLAPVVVAILLAENGQTPSQILACVSTIRSSSVKNVKRVLERLVKSDQARRYRSGKTYTYHIDYAQIDLGLISAVAVASMAIGRASVEHAEQPIERDELRDGCDAAPGTGERLDIMKRRAELGLPLVAIGDERLETGVSQEIHRGL